MKRFVLPILVCILLVLCVGCEEDNPEIIVPPANNPPQIESLTASATSVQAGHTVTLLCRASDTDGDSLSYFWLTTNGATFIGRHTDTLAIWMPPYTATQSLVYVNVSDGKETVRDSLTITVSGWDDRIPVNPTPADLETGVAPRTTLRWEVGEDVEEPLTYDLYLSSGQNLLRVAEGLNQPQWEPEFAFQPSVQYRWRVAARPQNGEEIFGAIWVFTVEDLQFGPPLGEILYRNHGNLIATWSPEGERYLRRVGTESFIRQPSRLMAWAPGYTTSTTPAMALYDLATSTLFLVDENGQSRKQMDDALPAYYAFSGHGSRFAYARNAGGGRQELISQGVPPLTTEELFASIEQPWRIASRPSYSTTGNTIAVALVDQQNSSIGRLAVFARENELMFNRAKRVWEPQYSPAGGRTAWLEANGEGQTQASHLFLASGSWVLQDSLELAPFGAPVTSFSWSPDGTTLAMFVRSTSANTGLIFCNVASGEITEVTLHQPIVMPSGERAQMRPEWSPNSEEVTVPVRIDDGYLLLAVTPSGGTRVLAENLHAPTHAAWR